MPIAYDMSTGSKRNRYTRFVQIALNGIAIATALPPSQVAGGTWCWARDTKALSLRVAGAGGATPSWQTIVSIGTVGTSTSNTTYLGGTVVSPTSKGVSFTAGGLAGAEFATDYEITATGITATLDSGDPIGTRYEFSDKTGNAAPNFTVAPNGGKTITGPGTIAGASILLNVQGFWRAVKKQSDGNWLMSGI